MSAQLSTERNELAKAREEMLIEQRRIISECYEEKRRITDEKNQFTIFQKESIDQTKRNRTQALQVSKFQHFDIFLCLIYYDENL